LRSIQEAVSFARTLSEPLGLAHALFFAAIVHQLRREPLRAQEYADATVAISDQHGLTMYKAMATIVRSWAVIVQGGENGLIEDMQNGLATLEAQETELVRPHFLALLVEGFEKSRRLKDGFAILDEALAIVNGNGEGYYEAELYRLKGELLCETGRGISSIGAGDFGVDPVRCEKAEHLFRHAIEIAQRQKAKSLELRTVVSLARLYKQKAMHQEARQLVAELYKHFAEGFDTADLREAKTLLNEL
jgi:predicted ATPase